MNRLMLVVALAALTLRCGGGSQTRSNDLDSENPADGSKKPAGGGDLPGWTEDTGTEETSGGSPDAGETLPTGTNGWAVLKPGTFGMGSTADRPCRETDETAHEVTLTHYFEISPFETTQQEFEQAMGFNPSYRNTCGPECPVESLNWHLAAGYCNALSEKAGLDPCYTCSGTGASQVCEQSSQFTAVGASIYECVGYRMPTDAEWEYAYRAGTTTDLYNANIDPLSCTLTEPSAELIGWYIKNAASTIHPVGQKAPNAWGLYDMAGNAQEWVNDFYKADLGTADVTDPIGGDSATQGVIRGGSFAHSAEDLRGAHRKPQTMANPGTSLGVRCARTLK